MQNIPKALKKRKLLLHACSVSSNKKHFERRIKNMQEIKHQYGNVLDRLVTKKLYLKDFEQAFKPDKEDIKTIICFK
jgi:hypothetical protein